NDRFQLMAPAPLNLVCFRYRASDKFNELLLADLNSSGNLYLTHTKLSGKYTLRLCIGQVHTTGKHVRQAWKMITEAAEKLEATI
ncbi:MAG: aspartate aminotransferase family protein, partial [Candidatus Neomarinimicrobiota bacterium]|nr:aspartate aminotransferase family protein [Candidatus Neomarinimicrobiota bacterium]